MLFLNNDDVKRVLRMDETIRVLEDAYRELFRGEATCRPRINLQIPTRDPSVVYNWASVDGGSSVSGYFAIRMMSDLVSYREYNGVRTREKYCSRPGLFCGLVLLTDVQSGVPLAMMNDGYLQHMRQGADAGLGVKYLARENAEVVGMFGSGGMARSHIDAFCAVRAIKRMVVYSPTRANREAYAAEMAEQLGIEVQAVDDPLQVYRGADILCGCTDATQPVILGRYLEPGMHLVEVGGLLDQEASDKLDLALRFGSTATPEGGPDWGVEGDSMVYKARSPGGERPAEGRKKTIGNAFAPLPADRTISLSDLLDGRSPGRTSPGQITYSERGGMRGVQFAAVAGLVYERAKEAGLGHEIPTDWLLQDIRD